MRAITVYCASSPFLDPAFHQPARVVGASLARRGIELVYGGGGVGLMGEVARAAKEAGGRVTGIITEGLVTREQGWEGCDEMIVVGTMRERKRLLAERGDGFLVLPGGLGTFEEFFEIWTGRLLGEHGRPLGLLNSDRYYDPLLELVAHGVEHRFIKPAVLELLVVETDPERAVERLIAAEGVAIDDDRFLPSGGRR